MRMWKKAHERNNTATAFGANTPNENPSSVYLPACAMSIWRYSKRCYHIYIFVEATTSEMARSVFISHCYTPVTLQQVPEIVYAHIASASSFVSKISVEHLVCAGTRIVFWLACIRFSHKPFVISTRPCCLFSSVVWLNPQNSFHCAPFMDSSMISCRLSLIFFPVANKSQNSKLRTRCLLCNDRKKNCWMFENIRICIRTVISGCRHCCHNIEKFNDFFIWISTRRAA